MNNKLSKKHHYLPRYYLKGFTDSEGRFYVYDKESEKIFSSGPSNTFFENHLNTIRFPDGRKSDFLERLHSEVENKSWESLDNIRNSNPNTPIQPLDKMHLYLFLLFLHWRLPSNFEYLGQLSEDLFKEGTNLDYLQVIDESGNSAPDEVIDQIRSSPIWEKAAQTIVPFAPFFNNNRWFENLEKWRFLYTEDSNSWYIVGDNPIVSHGTWDHDPIRCLEEFILPVSGSILLINLDGEISDPLSPEFTIQFGTAIIERANRFVACHNKDLLEALVDFYKTNIHHDQKDDVIPELFNMAREKS